MIREQLYKRTVDILFNSYFNDTLSHSFCTSCAVGNMVAANCGYKLEKIIEDEPKILNGYVLTEFNWVKSSGEIVGGMQPKWWDLVSYPDDANLLDYETRKEIASTGYSVPEIIMIESAFEEADKGNDVEDWVFNGLVDVLEALRIIHAIGKNDDSIRFKEHYKTRKQLAIQ